MRTNITTIAEVLAKALDHATVAVVLDNLLGAEANPHLTDAQADLAARLFDALSDAAPVACDDAAQGTYAVTRSSTAAKLAAYPLT